jgi:hypothetical protein
MHGHSLGRGLLEAKQYTVARSGRSRKKAVSSRTCCICSQRSLGGGEVYVLKGESGISIFDVDKAKQTVSDGRSPHLVPAEMLSEILQFSEHEVSHLSHVNPEIPGIIGQRFGGPFLLDGVHRGVRCRREGRDFRILLLSPEETRLCLLSQDIAETDVGIAVRELRKLLAKHPESDHLEVSIECTPEALAQIRKLLTKEENARITITIRAVLPSNSP